MSGEEAPPGQAGETGRVTEVRPDAVWHVLGGCPIGLKKRQVEPRFARPIAGLPPKAAEQRS